MTTVAALLAARADDDRTGVMDADVPLELA